jgi:hypothetical protein
MTTPVPDVSCWQCGRPNVSSDASCAWCGVWLVELDASVAEHVPALLPLARRWGIADDGYRSDAVRSASDTQLRAIVSAVGSAPDALWDWLASPEQATNHPTDTYVAITCLTMAYDEARLQLKKRHPG